MIIFVDPGCTYLRKTTQTATGDYGQIRLQCHGKSAIFRFCQIIFNISLPKSLIHLDFCLTETSS